MARVLMDDCVEKCDTDVCLRIMEGKWGNPCMIWGELEGNQEVAGGGGAQRLKGQLTSASGLETGGWRGEQSPGEENLKATVCRGRKRAINRGRTEGTASGLGKHSRHHSLPSPLAHSFARIPVLCLLSVPVSLVSNHQIYHHHLILLLPNAHCTHPQSFLLLCSSRSHITVSFIKM